VPSAWRNALLFLFLLYLLRAVLRNQWIAAAAFTAVFLPLSGISSSHLLLDLTAASLAWGITAIVLLRWGPLALAMQHWFYATLTRVPITTHTGAWYYGSAIWMLVLLVAMAAWALRTSMKGQRLLRTDLFT